MHRFRIVLALLALATLAGCATSSAHAGRRTQTHDSGKARAEQATESTATRTTPAVAEPEVAPAPSLSNTQAEFFCGASGALERRAPTERPAGVVAFSADMTRPEKLSGPQPFYTRAALERNVQGQMLARCILTREGSVRSCRILKPLPVMDEEVLLSLCASRYTPALDAGQPVDVEYTFNVRLTPP